MTLSISARQVTRHLRALRAGGMTNQQIADAAGITVRIIQDLATGRQPRLLRDTAHRLLAVTNPAPGPTGTVPAIGVLRRIQALLAMGWPHHQLDARTQLDTEALLYRGRGWVEADIHLLVGRVYDTLSMQPGPCMRTRDEARAGGYAPPLGWDEDTLDDPAVLPNLHGDEHDPSVVDEAAVLRRIAGDRVHLTHNEAAEVIARMRRAGMSDAHIARLTRLRIDRYVPLRRDLAKAA